MSYSACMQVSGIALNNARKSAGRWVALRIKAKLDLEG